MSDRRTLRSNGTVAHISLKGQVEAKRFTEGEMHQVIWPSATIWSAPENGTRDREVLFGAAICVLEDDPERDSLFGYAIRDGYVGYFDRLALGPLKAAPTHVVCARLSYALDEPDFKTQSEHFPMSLGARVRVTGQEGRWAQIDTALKTRFLPANHLRSLNEHESDPVTVAERLLGTPYVWGGNSSSGIDCSGLVQAGCLACGIPCPGDSDMQEAELGAYLPDDAPLQRGDLLFWKGHVAWVADPDTLLHANIFHMAVAYEPLQDAIKRIADQGDGPVTTRKRLGGPT